MASEGDSENVRAAATRMVLYGQFLLATGAYGYHMSEYSAKSKHGLFMGLAGDVAMCAMAMLSLSGRKVPMMIGIHLGMLLPAIFAAVFAWQASKQWPGQADRFRLFVVMAVGSIAALFSIVANKPKSDRKKDK